MVSAVVLRLHVCVHSNSLDLLLRLSASESLHRESSVRLASPQPQPRAHSLARATRCCRYHRHTHHQAVGESAYMHWHTCVESECHARVTREVDSRLAHSTDWPHDELCLSSCGGATGVRRLHSHCDGRTIGGCRARRHSVVVSPSSDRG
jgi:hypothetical protein